MVRQVQGGDQLFGRTPDGRVVDPDLIDGGLRSKQFATVLDFRQYTFTKPIRTRKFYRCRSICEKWCK
mgnify:CR=1 FL=1